MKNVFFPTMQAVGPKPLEHRTAAALTHGRRGGQRLGFTLIEVLVVVSIIVLLLSVLIPSISYARHAANNVKCVDNLHRLGLGMQQFAQASGSHRFPTTQYYNYCEWQPWMASYVSDPIAGDYSHGCAWPTYSVFYCTEPNASGGYNMYCAPFQLGWWSQVPAEDAHLWSIDSVGFVWNPAGTYCPAPNYLDFWIGMRIDSMAYPDKTPMIADSANNSGYVGNMNSGNGSYIHEGRNNVVLMDAHVESFTQSQAGSYRWSALYGGSWTMAPVPSQNAEYAQKWNAY